MPTNINFTISEENYIFLSEMKTKLKKEQHFINPTYDDVLTELRKMERKK
jgi:hypothetical protein